ncbi:MAG: fasciclin domain-containing protein, partial [Caulobacteraceae bacterium]|nr:fasciclin domain-containing protein [Caulobacteraceae bacterium]
PAAAFAQAAAPDAAAPPAPAAPAASPVAIAPAGDLADTLKASGQFTILVKALDASNLTGVLKSAGPLTVLAPTDDAFKALPPGQLDSLLKIENAGQLQQLLIYHLINAAVTPAKIQGSIGPIRTVAGTDVQINATGTPIKINDANVVGQATVSNGNIYAVDKVLTPGWTPPAAAPAAPAPAAPPAQ